MLDHEEEDKDLNSQVAKGQPSQNDDDRGAREETPGPEGQAPSDKMDISESAAQDTSAGTASNTSENSDTKETSKPKVIPESALPDKLVSPIAVQENK